MTTMLEAKRIIESRKNLVKKMSESKKSKSGMSGRELDTICTQTKSSESEIAEVTDDVNLLYSANTFIDVDRESTKTRDTEKDDLDDLLNDTNHMFIHKIDILKDEDENKRLSYYNNKTIACYSIENRKGELVLKAKQVEVGHYDQGRVPISYDVFNRFGHLIFTTDGNETKCGMSVLIKGQGEVTRGKVSSHGVLNYSIQDFLTGQIYDISFPFWAIFFTCLLYCFHPSVNIIRKSDTNLKTKSKLIASIGNRKWLGTAYSSKLQFCLHFEKDTEPDTKLFLFSSALVIFHLYFKKTGKELRCLLSYSIILTLIVLIVMIGIYAIYPQIHYEQSKVVKMQT